MLASRTHSYPGCRYLILAAMMLLVMGHPAQAQDADYSHTPPGRIGAGVQVGPFSGLTLKGYARTGRPRASRLDSAVLTVSFGGRTVAQLAILDEMALPQSPLTLYLGPAPIASFSKRRTQAGLAGIAGVRFLRSSVEIFLELSPRLFLLPELEAEGGAGIGFRIYPR